MSGVVSQLPESCHLTDHFQAESTTYRMAVVGTDREGPLVEMLEELFDRQPVEFVDETFGEYDSPLVALLDGDEVIATSPLESLSRTVLTVNSDLYITGSMELEAIDLPDVIEALSETTFHVRGYPESHYEKLPLILISRSIERLSYEHGGTHRASFQRLSRIVDERGTKNVYRKLSDAGVDTHVYGIPDWVPPRELDVTMHGGYGGDFDSTWFVLHRSPEEAAALVAIEIGANEWVGTWTFDRSAVEEIEATITNHL